MKAPEFWLKLFLQEFWLKFFLQEFQLKLFLSRNCSLHLSAFQRDTCYSDIRRHWSRNCILWWRRHPQRLCVAEGQYLKFSNVFKFGNAQTGFWGILDQTRNEICHNFVSEMLLNVASPGKDCDHEGERDNPELYVDEGALQAGFYPGPVPHSPASCHPWSEQWLQWDHHC